MKKPSFNSIHFVNILKQLHSSRKANKVSSKRKVLTKSERLLILEKTDQRCHVCGIELTDKFQADHVKSHSSGAEHSVANYLPSCSLCNNYRWHYSPEEIQLILKIGIWAKTQIIKENKIGKVMCESFIKHEERREKRRKKSK